MTEKELREKCGLEENGLIDTNLGLLDILLVKDDVVFLGVLANGKIIEESVESVVAKMTSIKV